MMDQQHAGSTTIVLSPSAFSVNRMAITAPHPGHPTCAEYIYSLSFASSCINHPSNSHPDAFLFRKCRAFGLPVYFLQQFHRYIEAADPRYIAEDWGMAGSVAQGGAQFLGEDA